MDEAGRADIATALLDAYLTREPIEPLSSSIDDLTLADAYDIQLRQIAARVADGRTVVGHKVGLTSIAMQRQLGVDQPDYGHLTDDMVFSTNASVAVGAYLQPRIEPEIAFVLREPLCGPGVTAGVALAAVEFVLPALEIIDSRIRDWRIGLLDTIADNASSAGVVLGGTPVRPMDVDLRLSGCVLYRNGEVAATGAGGAVLGSPVNALVWLANTLAQRGITLEPGHVVLPGSQTASVSVSAGDTVTGLFGGIGSVTVHFTSDSGTMP